MSYQKRCEARLIVNRHTMLANRQIIVNLIFGFTLQFFMAIWKRSIETICQVFTTSKYF